MSEEIKEEINSLVIVRDNIKNEIKSLNIKLGNIQTGLVREQVNRESEKKFDELQELKNQNLDKKKENKRLDMIVQKEYMLEQREQRFKEQLEVLHRREQELVDLETRRKKLNEERNTFNNYKINILKELEQAKITIEESKVSMDSVKALEENLRAREKQLKRGLQDLEQQQAVLNKERRDWEIYKNSELIPA